MEENEETKKKNPIEWPVDELEQFFQGRVYKPDKEYRLDNHTLINQPKHFVASHLAMIRVNNGNPAYKPYYDRLVAFKYLLEYSDNK